MCHLPANVEVMRDGQFFASLAVPGSAAFDQEIYRSR